MNEEYLWDRTGDDPEIERLEQALTGFRYKEVAPPVLPVTMAAADTVTSFWRRFSLPLAFAACAVIATVILAAIVIDRNARRTVTMPGDLVLATGSASDPVAPGVATLPSLPPISKPLPEVRPAYAVVPRSRAENAHRRSHAARMQKEVILTPEEKDAYSRLLLALSITGSKLRIVTDTINRADDDASARDPNNR